MHFNEHLHKSEPDTKPALRTLERWINLSEQVEDAREHVVRDADAVVFYADHEFVATFGLIATIAGAQRYRPALTPMLVGLYITAAYWFTASTSFANPAVTVARSLTDSFAGIAPVKEASGNTVLIHVRWACPQFVRQTFHEWAACSIPECAWAKAYYDRMKARGKSHHVVVRALAFKWMRILYRCWKDRKPYREQTYLDSLAKRNLPLQQLAQAVQMP